MGCGGILRGFSGHASSEMDSWFARHPKAEWLFQHNLIKNNQGDLTILDIEYAGRTSMGKLFRLDMLGVYKVEDAYKLIVFENKYGNGAIGGAAGLRKRYEDIVDVLSYPDSRDDSFRVSHSDCPHQGGAGSAAGAVGSSARYGR